MKLKGFFFLSEAPKAMKLKYKHKQNKNEKKNQNKKDPINLRYSNGETEGRQVCIEGGFQNAPELKVSLSCCYM